MSDEATHDWLDEREPDYDRPSAWDERDEPSKTLYRYSVEIKAFGRISVQTVEARSEAEALRLAQEAIGYSWKTSPMAFARFTDNPTQGEAA